VGRRMRDAYVGQGEALGSRADDDAVLRLLDLDIAAR
jgi:hypothetical protein